MVVRAHSAWYALCRRCDIVCACGAVAQLEERRVRNAEVEGSIPFGATIFLLFCFFDFCSLGALFSWALYPKSRVSSLAA